MPTSGPKGGFCLSGEMALRRAGGLGVSPDSPSGRAGGLPPHDPP